MKKRAGPIIECTVHVNGRVPRRRAVNLARLLFRKFSRHKVLLKSFSRHPEIPDLALSFVDGAWSKKLNFTYREKDYATDVLSFSAGTKRMGLGELVFCVPVLKRQARAHGLSFERELDYLVIHGFLHLLGYDHEKSRKEELKMMRLQDKLFDELKPKRK